ncbi:hypothetical protein [Methylobacterium sp. WL6]|uniref:hypothetical protein n=1 Tax=Methylobacterium sp. WL6 TaxID=2603901 RepID=UPI0011C72FA7|nr:hypothetical protein [Methylobacterium sp. WL6]TXN64988.1 hypothetical protein FV230_17585 [Methylobacterium sp. WL6]
MAAGVRTSSLPLGVLKEVIGHYDAGNGQLAIGRASLSALVDALRGIISTDPTGIANLRADVSAAQSTLLSLADALNSEATARGTAVSTEVNARIIAVGQLNNVLTALIARLINQEINDRATADSNLSSLIVDTSVSLSSAVNSVSNVVGAQGDELRRNLEALRSDLEAEVSALVTLAQLPDLVAMLTTGPGSGARPGDGRSAFTMATGFAALAGPADGLAPLPLSAMGRNDTGAVVRIVGARIVAAREVEAIEPGRIREVRATVVRLANASDPNNDLVRTGVFWLDQAENPLAGNPVGIIANLASLTTSTPRQLAVGYVARKAGPGITLVAPYGAVYFRRFVQTFGADSVTGVETLASADVTGQLAPPPVTQDVLSRLTAQEAINSGSRLTQVEQQLGAPNLITPTTRSAAAGQSIAASVQVVRTLGRATAKDGLGTDYGRITGPLPAGADGFTSQDGAIWLAFADPLSIALQRVQDGIPTTSLTKNGSGYYARPLRDHNGELVATVGDLLLRPGEDGAPKLQTAANGLAAGGGGPFRLIGRMPIDTPLVLKNNTTLESDLGAQAIMGRVLNTAALRAKQWGEGGAVKRNIFYADVERIYTDPTLLNAALVISPTASVTLGPGCKTRGVIAMRKGLPSMAPDANPTGPGNTGSETYAGTAFIGAGDGVQFDEMMVLGFEHALRMDGFQSLRSHRVLVDCLNGLDINDCNDIGDVRGWHGFPWLTIMSGTPYLTRPGWFVRSRNSVDFMMFSEMFAYGFKTPYISDNAQSTQWLNCCADSVAQQAIADIQVQTVFTVKGDSDHVRIIGGHTASAQTLLDVELDEYGDLHKHVSIVGHIAGTLTGPAYLVRRGDLEVTGGKIVGGPVVLKTLSPTSRVTIGGGFGFRQITDVPFDLADTTQLQLGAVNFGDWPNSKSPFRKTPLAGDRAITFGRPRIPITTLSAPWGHSTFTVTGPADGSGGNGNMLGGYPERRVRLYAAVPFTLYGGDTAGMGFRLIGGAGSLAVPAGTWVEFEYDDAAWQQVRL